MTSCEIDVPHIPTTSLFSFFSISAIFILRHAFFSLARSLRMNVRWLCENIEMWKIFFPLKGRKKMNFLRFSEINKFKIGWLIRLPMTFLPFQSDAAHTFHFNVWGFYHKTNWGLNGLSTKSLVSHFIFSCEFTSICLNASRTRPYMSRERKTVRFRLDIYLV